MRPHSRAGNSSHESPENSPHGPRPVAAGRISARHDLLGDSWILDVEALESAIGRFDADGRLASGCEVVFFEIAGDGHLHVNVTHRYATKAVSGWAGPGHVPGGFVHNRRFGDASQTDMIRNIRKMVFAERM